MLKYSSFEIYTLICLCTVVVTVAAGWLVLYIRDRRYARRMRDAERVRYIERLEKKCNFYRLQYQTRDVLDKYEQTVAFEKMRNPSTASGPPPFRQGRLLAEMDIQEAVE